MNVLITGGCGFLGKHLLARLEANKDVETIVVADNLDPLCGSGGEIVPVSRGQFVYANVANYPDMLSVCYNFHITHICHLAAYGRNLTCQDHPLMAWQSNVNGTLNVLEVARRLAPQVKRVVCCSSNITLSPCNTVYKASKEAVESLVSLYATLGLSCVGLRPSNIYGAGQSKTEYQLCAFAGLDSYYFKYGCFLITSDGTQARDWVHADDVSRAFEQMLTSPVVGKTYDIATGKLTSMNEIAAMLGVPVQYTDPRPGDAKVLVSDTYNAYTHLGYSTQLRLEDHIFEAFPSVPRKQ